MNKFALLNFVGCETNIIISVRGEHKQDHIVVCEMIAGRKISKHWALKEMKILLLLYSICKVGSWIYQSDLFELKIIMKITSNLLSKKIP